MEALNYIQKKKFIGPVHNESYINGKNSPALHTVSWMPENDPKAVVMLVHGVGDHILRYQTLAESFTAENIGVVGIDLRGYGKSGGRRGGASYNELLHDVSELISFTQKKYPYIPRILYGHGMGGNLALYYSIKNKISYNGIVASSPWLDMATDPPLLYFLTAWTLKKICPVITTNNGVDVKNLSHDNSVIKDYTEDSLVHNKISPKLYFEAKKAGEFILKNRHKLNTPLLLMHGSSDKITSWEATAEFAAYTSNNTTFKLWKGAFHELHNEFDKEVIFDYFFGWLKNVSSLKQRIIYGNF